MTVTGVNGILEVWGGEEGRRREGEVVWCVKVRGNNGPELG